MSAVSIESASDRAEFATDTNGPHVSSGRTFRTLCAVVLVLFAVIWLIPLLWTVDLSFRPDGEITLDPTTWWTSHPTLAAYRSVIGSTDILTWYMNSFLTAAISALFAVVCCSMAGFALARTRFAGRRIMIGLLLIGLLVPPQALMVPMFQEFASIGLTNTYWALILPSVAVPVAVFVFLSFFAGIPAELGDAARVDGANWFRVYSTIYMPLSRPAVSAVAIFVFVWTWNSLLWPLLVLSSTRTMTIPVGLASLTSTYGARYAEIMASAVLGALPLLAVFVLFQRRIVEGMASTGLKG